MAHFCKKLFIKSESVNYLFHQTVPTFSNIWSRYDSEL